MKGGSSTNNDIVAAQRREAAVAEQRERERQQRLQHGRNRIAAIFRGGIEDDFYDGYENTILDYYNPEIDRQYGEAREQNLFDLARRGLLRSTAAAERSADTLRERNEAREKVASDASNAVGNLKSDVNAAERSAYNILTATEDPTAAANNALTEVNAIQTRGPELSPLGDIFSSVVNAYSNYQAADRARRYRDTVMGRGPNTTSGRNVA